MDPAFWHQKWEANDIGFHGSQANPMLVANFSALALTKGSRIFVPLCGKTLDIAWLLSNGYPIAGAELSELAITQLFAELGIKPVITELGAIKHYGTTDIDIFVGNIFDLTRTLLGPIDAIYDRAALVALLETMRAQYAKHLIDITRNATQLLITYDYDQSQMQGPPFAVTPDEVRRHYEDSYEISTLATSDVKGGRAGTISAKENVWLLKKVQ